MGWSESDIPVQSGRTAVVTGANSGIGFETARALAAKGARVVLACRSPERGRDAESRLRAAMPEADARFMRLDLGSLASIEAFAKELAAQEPRLDLLCNNAGVMMPPLGHTEDGFETQLGTNHATTPRSPTHRASSRTSCSRGSSTAGFARPAHPHWRPQPTRARRRRTCSSTRG